MKNNFKFSIIISMHNSEKYLNQCINSIINQTFDFESNIQLILIDDGSSDKTKEISLEYVNKYPNNIILLTQEHEGVACARNYALKYVTGKYIQFLDSDDYISENTLFEVFKIFEEKYDEIDLITIPIKYIDRINDKNENTTINKNDGIIDLSKNPNYPQIEFSASFLKYESIKHLEFKTNLIYSEDNLLLNKILLNKEKFYSISNVRYYKRKRFDLMNRYEQAISKKEYYINRVKNYHLNLIEYCLANKQEIPKFIQYNLLYDLLDIVKKPEIKIIDTESEKNEFFENLKDFLKKINDEVIINNKFINKSLESFLIYLKKGKLSYELCENNVLIKIDEYIADELNSHNFELNNVEFDNNYLFISGFLRSLFEKEVLSIDALVQKDNQKNKYSCSYVENSKNDEKFISIPWGHKYEFNVKIPMNEIYNSKINLIVNYHDHENKTISTYLSSSFTNKCQLNAEKNTVFKNNKKIEYKNNTFYMTRGYKFSVVMAIYNTEEYVEEAIQSVINQNIGFKENIQLILVDDGSTDNTPEILSKYEKEYPKNITLLTQENQGQANARNNGLNYIKGKYVNFLDSDDILSEDAMKEAYQFLEKNYNEIDFVSIRQMHFGRKNTTHMLNFRFEKGDRIIDLIEDPNNPQLACNAVFFKENLFKKYKFPTNVVSSEDAILVNKILMDKKKYGVLEKPIYYYRKRENLTSTIDIVETKKEYYTEKLKNYYLELINYSIEKEGKVLEFIQYLCAYDLQWMLNQPTLDALETTEEKEEFWMYLKEVINHLDYQTIAYNHTVNTRILKTFFIYLKNNDLHVEIDKYNVSLKSNNYRFDELVNHDFWTGIDFIEIKNSILTISGYFNSYFNSKNISIVAIKFEKDGSIKYYPGKYVKYTSRENRYFLDKPWKFNYNFDININLEKDEESIISLKVCYHKDGDSTNYNKENIFSTPIHIKFSNHANLSNISDYQIWDDKLIFFNAKTKKFHIHKNSFKSKIKHEMNVIKNIITSKKGFYLESIILRLMHFIGNPFMKNKKIYLFSDRGTEADDNAMHLFKYALSLDDNIDKYMILSKNNRKYKELSKIGKMLNYKSFKHKLIYLFADKIISTHPYKTIINPFFKFGKNNTEYFSGLNNPKIYFLQHGVTKDNISSWFSKFDKNVSLISTVSDKEKESFYEEGYGYDKEIIQTLGFPRFDTLLKNSKSEKKILIIPTWRKNLKENKGKFIDSYYFKSINNLLNNEELLKISEKGYEIIFKPHPELNKKINDKNDERYIDLFNIPEKIILAEKESYSELFKKASLMITDYSSVFFDFAYLKKPVIYYHPADDYHYAESYFDYETMGFGDVIKEEKMLIKKINEYLSNDCVMENKYKENVDKFFKYNDDKNSERVYEWIKNN